MEISKKKLWQKVLVVPVHGYRFASKLLMPNLTETDYKKWKLMRALRHTHIMI